MHKQDIEGPSWMSCLSASFILDISPKIIFKEE